MSLSKTFRLAGLLAAFYALCRAAGPAPLYKLLYSPPVSANIGYMYAILEAEPGVFYVLSTWESNAFGPSIFSITGAGKLQVIHSFPPYTRMASMVQGVNGTLYAPAQLNPSASSGYFSMDLRGKGVHEISMPASWSSALKSLATPSGVYDIVGQFKDNVTTSAFARIADKETLTILHRFSAADGFPYGGANLAYAADGNIYGIATQQENGVSPGFVFRLTPAGDYSRLVSLPELPRAATAFPLISASDGNLYGTFGKGGKNGTGLLYRVTLSGQYQLVADFPPKGLRDPWTLMQAADGNLYGTTNLNQIFRYNLANSQLAMVLQLEPNGTQGKCGCLLVEGMDGKLYGLAPYGGSYPGIGAVFSLDIGLPKPKPVVSEIYPASGPSNRKVVLWGNYLLGVTSVTFNGVPAAIFSSTSTNSIEVTVPARAATGPVAVTTVNGSFSTTRNFTAP